VYAEAKDKRSNWQANHYRPLLTTPYRISERSSWRGAKPDILSSLQTNLAVTEILDAARRSAASGRTVTLATAN
jgi:hypothetical protein